MRKSEARRTFTAWCGLIAFSFYTTVFGLAFVAALLLGCVEVKESPAVVQPERLAQRVDSTAIYRCDTCAFARAYIRQSSGQVKPCPTCGWVSLGKPNHDKGDVPEESNPPVNPITEQDAQQHGNAHLVMPPDDSGQSVKAQAVVRSDSKPRNAPPRRRNLMNWVNLLSKLSPLLTALKSALSWLWHLLTRPLLLPVWVLLLLAGFGYYQYRAYVNVVQDAIDYQDSLINAQDTELWQLRSDTLEAHYELRQLYYKLNDREKGEVIYYEQLRLADDTQLQRGLDSVFSQHARSAGGQPSGAGQPGPYRPYDSTLADYLGRRRTASVARSLSGQ